MASRGRAETPCVGWPVTVASPRRAAAKRTRRHFRTRCHGLAAWVRSGDATCVRVSMCHMRRTCLTRAAELLNWSNGNLNYTKSMHVRDLQQSNHPRDSRSWFLFQPPHTYSNTPPTSCRSLKGRTPRRMHLGAALASCGALLPLLLALPPSGCVLVSMVVAGGKRLGRGAQGLRRRAFLILILILVAIAVGEAVQRRSVPIRGARGHGRGDALACRWWAEET